LVLWDIDHTLVDLAGAGRAWYEAALLAMGVELHTHPDYGGRTERAITTDALTLHGLEPTEDNIQLLWQHLIRESETTRSSLPASGRALVGAAEAITELDRCGAVQTLVTGNLPDVAVHKLEPFGLERHLDLEIGGYGTLSTSRPDLVAHAIDAATAKYGPFSSEQVAVIGDTPHDVHAALAHGVVAVAVATGRHDAAELTAAGAHTVLPDLADLDAVRSALLG